MRGRRRTGAVVLVAGLGLSGCTGGGEHDSLPVPSRPPTTAGVTTPSAAPTADPSGSPDPVVSPTGDYVLGRAAVRVLDVAQRAGGSRLEVVGPEGATYQLRTAVGVDTCAETLGVKDAHAGAGLPPNTVQHVQLRCTTARVVALTAYLLVSVPAGQGFTAQFSVPVAESRR